MSLEKNADNVELEHAIHSAARLAIQRCGRGLLTVEALSAWVKEEWEMNSGEEYRPSQLLLNRIALRRCSHIVYVACCSPYEEIRNCAFENLHRYLAHSLQHSHYASSLIQNESAADDALQMALAIIQKACASHPAEGPDEPSAFLKWALTILFRQAYAYVKKMELESTVSINELSKEDADKLEDSRSHDPEAQFDSQELQQVLKNSILSLNNKRYRQVLYGTYLAGMKDYELAEVLGVETALVYKWRYRALKALRSDQKVVEVLRLWLN